MCSASTNCAIVSNIGTSIRWPMPVRARASKPGEQRIGGSRTDDAVDRGHRDEARLAGGALQQHRNTRGRLDQVVVGRSPGIASTAAVADHAEIDDGGVAPLDRLIVEPQAGERLRTDVRDERLDRRHQAKQRLACRRLLEVHGDAALAARVVLEAAAHAAMPWHAGVAGRVALRRLDLDHVGAEVGQDPGAPGTHLHRGQIEHTNAGERSAHRLNRCTGAKVVMVAILHLHAVHSETWSWQVNGMSHCTRRRRLPDRETTMPGMAVVFLVIASGAKQSRASWAL